MDADWIYGKQSVDLDEVKELKVKLPLKFHVKLHSLKLLRGKTMSGTVADALEAYFAIADPKASANARPGSLSVESASAGSM